MTSLKSANFDHIIISSSKSWDLTTSSFLNSGGKTVIFKAGHYLLDRQLLISTDYVTLICEDGAQVTISLSDETNGLVISDCAFVTIKGLRIRAGHGNSIPITLSAVANCLVTDCFFYGNSNYFTVYWAGPKLVKGLETFKGYTQDHLDHNNRFCHNVVYGDWNGDCLTFALQKNGICSHNIIRGGKLAIYLCSRSQIHHNYIVDSRSHGIVISWPSHKITVHHNQIYRPKDGGITTMNQLEHGANPSTNFQLKVSHNFIEDGLWSGIEISDGHGVIIESNTIKRCHGSGISLTRSIHCQVSQNKISDCTKNILLDAHSNVNHVTENKMVGHKGKTDLAVHLVDDTSENTVSNNIILGYPCIKIGNSIYKNCYQNDNQDSNQIQFKMNSFHPYLNYHDQIG